MCLFTKFIINPRVKKAYKEGNAKEVIKNLKNENMYMVPVTCGECIECRKRLSMDWTVRLNYEIQENKNGKFMTMTFSNEALDELYETTKEYRKLYKMTGLKKYKLPKGVHGITTLAIRRFTERWRTFHKETIRHWLITELGHEETERIHIHGIIFTDKTIEEIEERWMYGWCDDGSKKGGGYVNGRTIGYITKYITKIDKDHPGFRGKIYASKGIGREFYKDKHNMYYSRYQGPEKTNDHIKLQNGRKIGMPMYYKIKTYSEEERAELWDAKIKKGDAFVLGQKIRGGYSSKKGEKELEAALRHARRINVRKGYGKGDGKKEYLTEEKITKMFAG